MIITTYNNFQDDMQIIEDLFLDEYEFPKLCQKMKLTETEWLNLKHGEIQPTREQLENIYNWAYARGLYLNEVHYLQDVDEFQRDNVVVCTHGSRGNIVGDISLNKQNKAGASNDFANGFYLGEKISQAGCWVAEEPDASLYLFLFDKTGLQEARFDLGVEWFLAVSYFREKLPEEYVNSQIVQDIIRKVDACDYVYAPIADNLLFDIIDDFIDGKLTDLQAAYSMATTHLGWQMVLKSDKAISQLTNIEHLYMCSMDKAMYVKENNEEMQTSQYKSRIATQRHKGVGQYIDEILL